MWIPSLPVTVLSAAAAGAGIVCIFKDMRSGPPYDKNVSAKGKTVIITGATSGIGKAAARNFALRGAKVFMACRDMNKCEEVRRNIVLETRNRYVYCRPCDLASLASVAEFAQTFKSEEPHLDVLVNNAAVLEPPEKITRDGFETHLGVNHLGHFLLTNLLLDTLKESAPSRVVVVSDSIHKSGKINREDLNFTQKYVAKEAYAQSKLANMLFARELGKRLLEHQVAVIAVDPGLTDTNLSRNMSMSRSLARYLIYPLFWPFMKTDKIGCQVILHAALDPKLEKCVGDYYVDMKKAEPSAEAQDFETAQWLWKVSEKWTKLDQYRKDMQRANAA